MYSLFYTFNDSFDSSTRMKACFRFEILILPLFLEQWGATNSLFVIQILMRIKLVFNFETLPIQRQYIHSSVDDHSHLFEQNKSLYVIVFRYKTKKKKIYIYSIRSLNFIKIRTTQYACVFVTKIAATFSRYRIILFNFVNYYMF